MHGQKTSNYIFIYIYSLYIYSLHQITRKNKVETDRAQIAIKYGARALRAGWRKHGYRTTLRICNIYCFSTATLVARTRLNPL